MAKGQASSESNSPNVDEIVIEGQVENFTTLAEAIAKNQNVTSIIIEDPYNALDQSKITELFDLLEQQTNITTLEVVGKIHNFGAFIERLKANKTLKEIALFENQLNPDFSPYLNDTARDIGALIENNSTLEKIKISGNSLSYDGAILTITEALKKNHTLKSLSISACELGPKATELIASAIEHNDSLENLEFNHAFSSDRAVKISPANSIIKAVQNSKTIKHLALNNIAMEHNERVTLVPALCEMIKNNTALQTLDLSKNSFNDEEAKQILEALKANTTLQHISLNNTPDISASTIKSISELMQARNSIPAQVKKLVNKLIISTEQPKELKETLPAKFTEKLKNRVVTADDKTQISDLLCKKLEDAIKKDSTNSLAKLKDILQDDKQIEQFSKQIMLGLSKMHFKNASFKNVGWANGGSFVDSVAELLCGVIMAIKGNNAPLKDWWNSNSKLIANDQKEFLKELSEIKVDSKTNFPHNPVDDVLNQIAKAFVNKGTPAATR